MICEFHSHAPVGIIYAVHLELSLPYTCTRGLCDNFLSFFLFITIFTPLEAADLKHPHSKAMRGVKPEVTRKEENEKCLEIGEIQKMEKLVMQDEL